MEIIFLPTVIFSVVRMGSATHRIVAKATQLALRWQGRIVGAFDTFGRGCLGVGVVTWRSQ